MAEEEIALWLVSHGRSRGMARPSIFFIKPTRTIDVCDTSSLSKPKEDNWSDPRWQKLRLEVLQRDGWKCQGCGSTSESLQVHHLSYNGYPWDTPMDNLQTLCRPCHERLGEHPRGGVGWSDGRFMWAHCPKCGVKDLVTGGEWDWCEDCRRFVAPAGEQNG